MGPAVSSENDGYMFLVGMMLLMETQHLLEGSFNRYSWVQSLVSRKAVTLLSFYNAKKDYYE